MYETQNTLQTLKKYEKGPSPRVTISGGSTSKIRLPRQESDDHFQLPLLSKKSKKVSSQNTLGLPLVNQAPSKPKSKNPEYKKMINKIKYELRKLKKCSTKYALKKFLLSCSAPLRRILRFYMRECLIFDIFTRRLECKQYLLSKRQFLFLILKTPGLLDTDCHFNNNILKNFCTGSANFLLKFLNKVICCFEIRGEELFGLSQI